MSQPAVLVLENGRVFRGTAIGPVRESIGEVVFNTSMTGYQEILSDPSYAGQIIVFTAPQIGNIGCNAEDMEASRVYCAGLAVRECSPVTSNWRSQGDLEAWLGGQGIGGIDGIDTRALTRELRDGGAQRGAISTATDDIDGLLARIRNAPEMEGQDLVARVTCEATYHWDEPPWSPPELPTSWPKAELSVVAVDYGIKHNILRDLRGVGCKLTVVSARCSAREILAMKPDGLFLSNGPGDPAAVGYAIETVRELFASRVPLFGICLGHQILALALGARTYKLPFGHHGGNHPVMDLSTRKVEITSQNHGFAVDASTLPDHARVSHVNLYDQTVEGIEVRDRPAFSVQYHPEASPGPHDSSYLFRRFVEVVRQSRR